MSPIGAAARKVLPGRSGFRCGGSYEGDRQLAAYLCRCTADVRGRHVLACPVEARVLPQLVEVSGHHAEKTIFTRFVPPQRAKDVTGGWKDYYRKWWMDDWRAYATGTGGPHAILAEAGAARADFRQDDLLAPVDGRLFTHLRQEGVDTVVVTGCETDVCVLATVLGSIDLGFHVIVLSDAVCSGADETHDAAVELLGERFSVQLELLKTDEFLATAG